MTTINLDKEFFTGGNATFTVENNKGEHFTFKIRAPREGKRILFGSVMSGPDNESSFSYIGIVNKNTGSVTLTKGSRVTEQAKSYKVLCWLLKHVFTDRLLPDGYQVRHAGKCGCCGRKLTEPLSLDRGIGPECWMKIQNRPAQMPLNYVNMSRINHIHGALSTKFSSNDIDD